MILSRAPCRFSLVPSARVRSSVSLVVGPSFPRVIVYSSANPIYLILSVSPKMACEPLLE